VRVNDTVPSGATLTCSGTIHGWLASTNNAFEPLVVSVCTPLLEQ
jgi:hypothetical protein